MQKEQYASNISIVNFSEVVANDMRLDAEYWLPKYIQFERKAKSLNYPKFKDLIIDKFSSGENLPQSDNGTPFIRTQNIKDIFLNEAGLSFTNVNNFDKLQEGDILFTRVGMGIGDSIVITKDWIGSAYSDNTICIRIKDNRINNFFLAVFFASNKARDYISRMFNGTAQPIVSKTTLSQLYIPTLSSTFQSKIERMVRQAHKLMEESKSAYKKAEEMLLKEVLGNWKEETYLNFWVENLSKTQEAERLDAEYFHPKYEALLSKIKSYKHGFTKMESLIEISNGIEPGSDEYCEDGIPFIRIADLTKFELSQETKFVSKEFYLLNQAFKPKKNQILLSKDGTPGIAYHLKEEPKEILCSSGIIKLDVIANFLPEVLTLIINSSLIQIQVERDVNGALIKHWLVNQIKSTIIPLLPKSFQEEIAELVNFSFEARRQSKQLLEEAKTLVEKAIEEGEN